LPLPPVPRPRPTGPAALVTSAPARVATACAPVTGIVPAAATAAEASIAGPTTAVNAAPGLLRTGTPTRETPSVFASRGRAWRRRPAAGWPGLASRTTGAAGARTSTRATSALLATRTSCPTGPSGPACARAAAAS